MVAVVCGGGGGGGGGSCKYFLLSFVPCESHQAETRNLAASSSVFQYSIFYSFDMKYGP